MENKEHKHKDLIIAWANGAEIERYSNESNCWVKTHKPAWSEFSHYRIKPQPKVVPFDLEEDAEKLIWKAVKSIKTSHCYVITGLHSNSGIVTVGDTSYYIESLLKYYTFLDGSPCGKYVEE